MTPQQFWNDDERLFQAYLKAYRDRGEFTAWIMGARTYEAVSKALSNAFAQSASEQVAYSEPPDREADIKAFYEKDLSKEEKTLSDDYKYRQDLLKYY